MKITVHNIKTTSRLKRQCNAWICVVKRAYTAPRWPSTGLQGEPIIPARPNPRFLPQRQKGPLGEDLVRVNSRNGQGGPGIKTRILNHER